MSRPNQAAQRRRREAHGRRAEWLAGVWLGLKGYKLLARRARTPKGELDIVARRGPILVFVEVKARRTRGGAIEAVTPAARRRIEHAAHLWAARRRDVEGANWRFDIIAITPGRFPHHLRDAWRPEGE